MAVEPALGPPLVPVMVHGQPQTVQPAPDHESPGGPVPEPAQQHGRHQIDGAARLAMAVAAQRDVEMVAQEMAQRDVPAAPELHDRGGFVRAVEVDRQAEAQTAGQAQRHVGIAREIEEDLQRVGNGSDPGRCQTRRVAPFRHREQGGGVRLDAFRDQDLLGETDGEQGEADAQIVPDVVLAGRIVELRGDLVVLDQRSGHDVREEADEKRMGKEASRLGLPAGDIHQVGDLLEGEEGDRQRQAQAQLGDVQSGQRIDIAGQEVGIFEEAEQGEIEDDPDRQQGLIAPATHETRDDMIGDHRDQQEQDVADEPERPDHALAVQSRQFMPGRAGDIPPSVEEETGSGEQGQGGPVRDVTARQIVGEQHGRQEKKQEFERIEDHASAVPRVGRTLAGGGGGGKARLHARAGCGQGRGVL